MAETTSDNSRTESNLQDLKACTVANIFRNCPRQVIAPYITGIEQETFKILKIHGKSTVKCSKN